MSPIRYLPTARDVDESARATSSAVPSPSASTSPYLDTRTPVPMVYIFLALGAVILFVLAVIFVSSTRSKEQQKYRDHLREAGMASSSSATLVNDKSMPQAPKQSIPPLPPAYTAARGSEDAALSRFTGLNTLKNQRTAQVSATPLAVEPALPPVMRPPGARW